MCNDTFDNLPPGEDGVQEQNSCTEVTSTGSTPVATSCVHGHTPLIDGKTKPTTPSAAALASANLNSGTDFVATTNTNIVMNTTSNTNNVVAPTSEGVSPDFTFTQSEVSPIGFNRTTFTEPQKPGSDWDTVYSGVCVDLMNQAAVTNQLVLKGDKLVLTRPTQLSVCMTVDDHGDLLISNTELADDAIQAAFDAAPKLSSNEAIITAFSGSLCFHMDLQGTEWQNFDSGASAWKRPVRTLVLPAGDYFIYGRVTNDPMKGGNVNNRKLFRYAIQAKQACDAVEYKGGIPQVCNTCGCGNTTEGDADRHASTQAPGWEGDACPSFVTLNPENGKALYDSPWRWTAAIVGSQVVITPPVGETLLFDIPSEDASEAGTAGASGMVINRIQYQDADFNPTTSRTPAYIMMKDADGLCMTFDMSNGAVYSITSPEGRKVTATDRAQHVQTQFDNEGNLLSCASAEAKLVCSTSDNGDLQLDWFTPDAAEDATPFKQETIHRSGNDTTLTRQQTGRDPHSLVRSESNGVVTITNGAGDEAIVHRYETTYPMNGLMVRTESVYFAATPDNVATCTRTVYNYSDAGWQLYSETEGFGSDVARSTSYIYNGNRLTKVQRFDGGYTEYEYDSLGRTTMQKSPWGASLAKVTRTTYAEARFFDVRPASVTEYHVNASGAEVLYRNTVHSYEDSAELERVTTMVTAGGSSQQQVSIEETFGAEPAYAYAAGKPKFSQSITGVQTAHEYEATSEHGAIHKHTSITKVNGELVAAQSRKSESFMAADDTTTFEQESIWDGTQWLLLDTTAYEYDEQQRAVKTTRGNGRFRTTEWMCCGRLSETDEDGITTTYAYNSARQLTEISREEVYNGETCITPETITEFTRDASGFVLSTTHRIGAMETTVSTEYDAIGRITKQTDGLGRVTSTAYSEDGLTTTVTTPAGATSITTQNTDGSTASISGTAQRAQVYVYELNGNSLRTTSKLEDGTTIAQSIVNGFGQTTVQAQASTTGFIYSRSEFNAKGQLVKQYQDTGWNTTKTAATLYEYDSFGNVSKQTLALADSPTKDNSPVVEMAHSVESVEDGVYSITTKTRYNANGEPLSAIQKHLISQLSATLASKSISTDERGNSATEWSEFTAPSKVTSYSIDPTSEIVAEAVSVDGFTTSQKDYAGITTSASRSYNATGMILVHEDGRGNATTSRTDLAGRTISVTDAAGAVTTTAYDAALDLPSVVTDAEGNTSCFKYDHRGRKIAEWGTAIQPACFGYDDMGNMTTLRTFRSGTEIISSDPTERTDYDQTTWAFHPATGLELSKTYADGTAVVKTYDAYKRLSTETDARGNIKTHAYEHARGLHLGTTYTVIDGTEETSARSFTYNHLGQMTQLTDDSGVRTFTYNTYGERECDSLAVDGDTHLVTELRDDFGRSIGYTYAKNGSVQQTVSTGYGTDGRINSAGFMHGGEMKQFGYEYLQGTNLLHKLTKPNGMTHTQTYETQRDLLTGMAYQRGTTLVAQREYTYDVLSRPTARTTSRQGNVVNDTFAHNSRSELASTQVNGEAYGYDYDNVGNRLNSSKGDNTTAYMSNNLNQYTSIQEASEAAFTPQFDADGNQTHIKTETGIWTAVYNAENRPVSFTNEASGTVVTCAYDSMGRRCFKKVTVNGTVTLHQRYLYRGYLQIACCDLTRSHHPALWFIAWDPTEPIATRPLAIQKDGTWYTYGLDLTKNVCEVFSSAGYIATTYTYSPYGSVTATGSVTQPIQWSSEIQDRELMLYYYNFRYYNAKSGRFVSLNLLPENNLYRYVRNLPVSAVDMLGLAVLSKHIEAADKYLASLRTQPNGNNAKCFRYGNIYPDIPFSENININIPSFSIPILLMKFNTPPIYISHEDLFLFLAENHLDRLPYYTDTKKAIDDISNAMTTLTYALLPSLIQSILSKTKIPDRYIRNSIYDIVLRKFAPVIENIQTLKTHFGSDSYWHAMSTGRNRLAQSAAYDNFKNRLGEKMESGASECKCWQDQGFALHMLVDLNTASHAAISKDGKVTINYMHYYPDQDKDMHKESDKKPDLDSNDFLFSDKELDKMIGQLL
ncbi:MAG: RHS repeat domain-containing protein, partial [Akkermansia sp.]